MLVKITLRNGGPVRPILLPQREQSLLGSIGLSAVASPKTELAISQHLGQRLELCSLIKSNYFHFSILMLNYLLTLIYLYITYFNVQYCAMALFVRKLI